MTNAPSSNPNRTNLLAMLGIFVLALVGVGFLVLAAFLLVRGGGGGASPAASPTRLATDATQIVFVPTTTQSPPTATLEPTVAPTATPAATNTAAASAPTATASAAHVVKIVAPANVRSGPGTSYPVVGGMNTGDTASVVGRDSSGQWFAVAFAGAPQGTGWVSALVASYDGTTNDLPVVQAASAPPPQATAVPPSAVPPTAGVVPTSAPAATSVPSSSGGANGIQTFYFTMHKTTGAPNESMFFDFKVVNTTSNTIAGYGFLAAHTDVGVTAKSWDAPLLPGKTLTHEDHINFPNTGTYQVYLGICYSDKTSCSKTGAWTRLSDSITVTIQ